MSQQTRTDRITFGLAELDYQQIKIWSAATGLEPLELLDKLIGMGSDADPLLGHLVELRWDLDQLPISRIEWIEGLSLQGLSLEHDQPSAHRHVLGPDPLPLPRLQRLECSFLELEKLDLSLTPELEELRCDGCMLDELKLDPLPKLAELDCSANGLAVLTLINQTELTWLNCNFNSLSGLNLARATKLQRLECSGNKLRELRLPAISELRELECMDNELVELDLLATPKLQRLWCTGNPLRRLDIRSLAELTELWFDPQITEVLARPDQRPLLEAEAEEA